MLRLCIFIIYILFSNKVLANCNFKTSNYLSELSIPKQIKSINIEIPKAGKYNLNFIKILVSKSPNILPHLKKKFIANVTVKYDFGECIYKAKVRQNGDWKDHIKLDENGKPLRSLNVRLIDGNILNATKFRLLIPETRNGLNEILGTLILRELDIISPETFEVNTNINDTKNIMLFQEISSKELLEKQGRREGPLFEGDESILWTYKGKEFKNFELESISLSRMINQKWFIRGNSSEKISLRAYDQLQNAYLSYSQEMGERKKIFISPNKKDDYIFNNFFLTLVSMNGLHGLRPHNRQYYFNVFLNYFEPIYYDGNLNLNKKFELDQSLLKLIDVNEIDQNYLNKLSNIKDSNEILQKFKNRVLVEEDEANIFFKSSLNNILKNTKFIVEELFKSKKNIFISKNYNEQIKNFQNFQNLKKVDQLIITDLLKENNEKYIAKTLDNDEIDLSINDVSNLISRNKINEKRSVYIKNINEKIPELNEIKKFLNQENSEIVYSKSLEINIDENSRKITFKQKKYTDWVLIKNINLFDWNINFIGIDHINSKIQSDNSQRFNSYGMTGCLNFHNVYFKETSLKSLNGNCEDAINIVNSKGNLNFIDVINAKADAVDIDFSQIEIAKLKVINAGNDCFDVSGGDYNLSNVEINNCGDKGISVGEKSILFAGIFNLDNSNIGVSSKDSSITIIDEANLINTEYCFEAAKKKQEFNGAKIKFQKLNCKENYIIDKNSLVEINKNEL